MMYVVRVEELRRRLTNIAAQFVVVVVAVAASAHPLQADPAPAALAGPTGTVVEFALPTPGSGPHGITAGPDGNLWFTEYYANLIGRVTSEGVITEFFLPTTGSRPQ